MNYFPPGMSLASPILVILRSGQSIAQAAQQADEIKEKFRERLIPKPTGPILRSATRKRLDNANQLITEFGDGPLTTARRLRNSGMEPKSKLWRRQRCAFL